MNSKHSFKTFILLILVSTTSCVQDDSFKIPELIKKESLIDGTVIDINAILGILAQGKTKDGEDAKISFADTNNYVSGYVISSDKAGNFFEELIIQNSATDATAGIRVLIDVSPLFTTYEIGRKIFIKLDGLSIGDENGVPSLGILSGNKIDKIPSFSQNDYILRSSEVAQMIPREIDIINFSDQLLNQYIKINNVQFSRKQVLGEKPLTFAAEPTDQFSGERIIESCSNGFSAILSTGTFSDFKGVQLPKNQGTFKGILAKSFFGDAYNLKLNDPSGLIFDVESRCDPNVLECVGESGGSITIFKEDFTGKTITDLENEGWINSNITGGKLKYSIGNFGTNQYAQITGFNVEETTYEIWLITPEINVDSTGLGQLSFAIQVSFDNGNILTPFITNTFTGDIATTNWTQLDISIPTGGIDSFGKFENTAPTNISCLEGKVRIGFRYAGENLVSTTRYHIDDIRIIGK